MSPAPAPRPAPASRYAMMNGIGNAILVVDRRGGPALESATARHLHERFAFDQLMAIGDAREPGTAAFVDIFNADGSRAGACGNGTRCVAWFLLEETGGTTTLIETEGGRLACRRDGAHAFTVDMGPPRLGWADIPLAAAVPDTGTFVLDPLPQGAAALGPCAAVSMGNPHAVFFPAPGGPSVDLKAIGPVLERHPMFPDRANISIARVLARDRIALAVWERGAGLTRACGSAACATLVAAVRRGLADRTAAIALPGGTLQIAWRAGDDHVLMSGPVELEHRGELAGA